MAWLAKYCPSSCADGHRLGLYGTVEPSSLGYVENQGQPSDLGWQLRSPTVDPREIAHALEQARFVLPAPISQQTSCPGAQADSGRLGLPVSHFRQHATRSLHSCDVSNGIDGVSTGLIPTFDVG